MSKARMTEIDKDSVVVKKPRAPRTRAVLSDEEKAVPRKRAPRRVTAESVTPVSAPTASDTVRKAPTSLGVQRQKTTRSKRALLGVSILCVVLAGIGIGVGVLDRGAIDVVAVVNDRNEKINRGEVRDEVTGEPVTLAVPVQTSDTRVNGGLQIADPAAVPQVTPVAVEATTTATTTEAAAVEIDEAISAAPAATSSPAL